MAAAEFKISRLKYNWTGTWTTGQVYNPDDVISISGKVYTCLVRHTADADFYNDLNYFNGDTPPLAAPRWELMSDGVAWKGNWATETFYNIGDIVKVAGKNYICLVAHTSAETSVGFVDDLTDDDDAGPDEAYWATYFDAIFWANTWEPDTFYGSNTVVKNSGKLYKALVDHISTTDAQGLLADQLIGNEKWEEFFYGNTWRGDWTENTLYYENDIVKYGGIVYQCIGQHLSALTVIDGLEQSLVNWNLIYDGVEYLGEWAKGTRYKLNDIVIYNGYLYKCKTYHYVLPYVSFDDTGDIFNEIYWETFVPGQQFNNVWNDETLYSKGSIVINGGWLFVSQNVNISSKPDYDNISSNPDWELLFRGTKVRGDWVVTGSYSTGDLVRRNGQLYVAKQNVPVGEDTDILNDGSSINPNYWELYIPGVFWKGSWKNLENYLIGDVIQWRGASYRCIQRHVSDIDNRPDQDEIGLFWEQYTYGDPANVLSFPGDIKTYGIKEDGSSIGTDNVEIGTDGQVLTVSNSTVSWSYFNESDSVYFVSNNGVDSRNRGTTQNSSWRTLKYALQNIQGPATVFLKSGIYEEILPMVIPRDVAVVGEELRGTNVRPISNLVYSSSDINNYLDVLNYIGTIVPFIIKEEVIGSTVPATTKYTTSSQNLLGDPATSAQGNIAISLINDISSYAQTNSGTTITGSNNITVDANRLNAATQIENNISFIVNETIARTRNVAPNWGVTDELLTADIEIALLALIYDLKYPGNYKSVLVGKHFYNGSNLDNNKISNMFYVQNGSGIRNLTLSGLEGELGAIDPITLTRRPSAGAFVSLDPGWGTNDENAWINDKSPYIQNVTNFGTACVGLKIDGDLHSGGNKSIVANDFTQILSDGIGAWCNSDGLTELVSVFTYYNHIGYLCTKGGKIRGTNGNCSYGQYGAVAENFNPTEVPITATVNNKYGNARVSQAFVSGTNNEIVRLFYNHSGENYTTATYTTTGAGTNAQFLQDEFRDGGISSIRLLDPGDSSTPGGTGYTLSVNTSQGGDENTIIIAGSEEGTLSDYQGLRIVLQTGTGRGQFGIVADYDSVSKTVWVAKETYSSYQITETTATTDLITVDDVTDIFVNDPVVFVGTGFGGISNRTIYYVIAVDGANNTIKVSATLSGSAVTLSDATGTLTMYKSGWEHFGGREIESTLDTTTSYYLEPRVEFSEPPTTITSRTLPSSAAWTDVAYGNGIFVAIENAGGTGSSNLAYSLDGITWVAGFGSEISDWRSVTYGGGLFVAVSSNGKIMYSTNGQLWNAATSNNLTYSSIAYGNGQFISVASGTNRASLSTDGITWTEITLSGGADWSDVVYGKGIWVAVAESDSSLTETSYSTDNGTTWSSGSFVGGCKSICYGNNRFVAVAGGYAGANNAFVSFNGVDWETINIPGADWRDVDYQQGSFIAAAYNEDYVIKSTDGKNWRTIALPSADSYVSITTGEVSGNNVFLLLVDGSNTLLEISTGTRSLGRVNLSASRINSIQLWEQGSGYTSAPVLSIFDPNNTSEVVVSIDIANGVLGNPSIISGGAGYATISTRISISGDGFADEYQTGKFIVVSSATRVPSPGDNLYVTGIDDYTYKVLNTEILGESGGVFDLRIGIAKNMGVVESPNHGTVITIRQQYSQVRLTGHDFLDIGLGNFNQTNYPNTLFPIGTVLAPEDETKESGGGRVFYTTTDQDGNYRVGELFAVEQASGTVTISADFFQLEGLEEISIGGVTVGGSGVVIREFSTDPLFVADSNNIIPTQRAIKEYIARRISGGGSDAFTGRFTAGVVRVGPRSIDTTTLETIEVPTLMRFNKPVNGTMLAQSFFLSGDVGIEDDY